MNLFVLNGRIKQLYSFLLKVEAFRTILLKSRWETLTIRSSNLPPSQRSMTATCHELEILYFVPAFTVFDIIAACLPRI